MTDADGAPPRVVEIVEGALDSARVRVDGGSSFFVLRDLLAAVRGDGAFPVPGQVLDAGWLAALQAADEASRAARKGLELLALAEHTRFLLSRKLAARGFPEPAVRLALDALERRGALDEARYCEAWLRSRLGRAPRGPAELLAGLLVRGAPGDAARAALDALFGPEERAAAAARLAEGRFSRLEPRVAAARLRALGFSVAEVRTALGRPGAAASDAPGDFDT